MFAKSPKTACMYQVHSQNDSTMVESIHVSTPWILSSYLDLVDVIDGMIEFYRGSSSMCSVSIGCGGLIFRWMH